MITVPLSPFSAHASLLSRLQSDDCLFIEVQVWFLAATIAKKKTFLLFYFHDFYMQEKITIKIMFAVHDVPDLL